jgi:hypothetical protein
MSFFKLVKEKFNHLAMDELILGRDESGNVEHSLSVREAREIPDELRGDAETLAARYGYRVEESDPPEDQNEFKQPVGDDVRGMSPTIGEQEGGQPGAQDQSQAPAPPQGTPSPGQVQTGSTGAGTTNAPASTSGQAAPAPGGVSGSTTTS